MNSAPSDQSVQLRQQMAQIRGLVRDHAGMLVKSAQQASDWRYHVGKYPWASLAVAATIGYLLMPRRKAKLEIDPKTVESAIQNVAREMHGEALKTPVSGLSSVLGFALPLLQSIAMRGALAYWDSRLQQPTTAPKNNHRPKHKTRKPR